MHTAVEPLYFGGPCLLVSFFFLEGTLNKHFLLHGLLMGWGMSTGAEDISSVSAVDYFCMLSGKVCSKTVSVKVIICLLRLQRRFKWAVFNIYLARNFILQDSGLPECAIGLVHQNASWEFFVGNAPFIEDSMVL